MGAGQNIYRRTNMTKLKTKTDGLVETQAIDMTDLGNTAGGRDKRIGNIGKRIRGMIYGFTNKITGWCLWCVATGLIRTLWESSFYYHFVGLRLLVLG